MTSPNVRTGFFDVNGSGSKAHTLFFRSVLPASFTPQAHVFYLPGVHESLDITAVERMAEAYTSKGWALHGHEYHGHGRSSGMPGYIESLDLLLTHAFAFVDKILQDDPDTAPFFISGHSMGGGLAVMMGDALAAKYGARFGGAVLWSPALDAQAPPALLLCLLRAVCSVWPSAQLGPPEDPYASFAELTEAQKYDECPHNYKGNMRLITGRMFVDFMFPRIRAGLQDGSLACDFPFLILHAEHDHIPISACRVLFDVAKTQDKEIVVLKGGSHQVLTDPGWNKPLEAAVGWISTHVSTGIV